MNHNGLSHTAARIMHRCSLINPVSQLSNWSLTDQLWCQPCEIKHSIFIVPHWLMPTGPKPPNWKQLSSSSVGWCPGNLNLRHNIVNWFGNSFHPINFLVPSCATWIWHDECIILVVQYLKGNESLVWYLATNTSKLSLGELYFLIGIVISTACPSLILKLQQVLAFVLENYISLFQ